jgi:hypothetical protein
VQILAGAQSFGFGPVAKLDGIAALLQPHPITFVGNGVALRYAQLNDVNFTGVENFDVTDVAAARDLIPRYDAVLSVMAPHLVYAAVREGRPAYFFDSLLGFWLADRSLTDLASAAAVIRTGSDGDAAAAFDRLTVHESMVVSHMIAAASYAQSFPGVAQRVEHLTGLGIDTVTMTGPMLDLAMIERLRSSAVENPRMLVANLGGFNNAFVDYEQRGSYVNIVLRWLRQMAPMSGLDEIVVCSGAFPETVHEVVGSVRFRIGLLSREDLMQLLSSRPVYLAAPGLTSLYEAAILGVPPMLLPDQHFGHIQNRRRLAGTQLVEYGATLDEFGFSLPEPQDDLSGTIALADTAAEIDRDPDLFNAFADYMSQRLATFAALTPRQRRDYVDELDERLGGAPSVPISRALAELQEGFRHGAAVLPG